MTIDRALADFSYAEPRFNVALFTVFAVLGLVLAVVGVYSVMASSVARQVHEVGVRMALGASPGSVFGMVVGRGARLIATGVASRPCRERARGARARELRVACLDRRPLYAHRRLAAPPRHRSSGVRVAGSPRLADQPNHRAQDRLTPAFTIRKYFRQGPTAPPYSCAMTLEICIK